jgi:hypothetical protein
LKIFDFSTETSAVNKFKIDCKIMSLVVTPFLPRTPSSAKVEVAICKKHTFSYLFLLIFTVLFFCNVAAALPLPYKEEKNGLELSIQKSSKSSGIQAEFRGVDSAKINVFYLSKPERVIVDLPVTRAFDWFRNSDIQNSVVARVRVGSDPKKVRFVFDLTRVAQGSYSVVRKENSLKLEIGGGKLEEENHLKSSITATPTAIQAPAATQAPVLLPTVTPVPTQTPQPQKSTPAAIEIEPTKDPAVKGESNKSIQLVSLNYEKTEKGEPSLRLKFSRVVSYQMVRSSRDLFVVTIDNVSLGSPELAIAHFPPADFSRFISARAQVEKNTLKIFVYIEEGSYLLSIPKGSEIWLKAYGT